MERSKQNVRFVGDRDNGVGDSVDNIDCCLTERSDPTGCVDDGKECVDKSVDDSVDDSDDGGDMHLEHVTQVENNVNLSVCDKHLTHGVKNTPDSLRSDVTGH
eukprot:12208800-Ditylum_brightwellii.AAC.1